MKKNTKILTLVFVVAFLFVGCLPTPTPSNEAPIITSTPITAATIGVLYAYDVNATDPDGDTLTYSLITRPTGMVINSANGLIMWTPVAAQVGNNSVTVKVSDKSLSIIQSFTIVVSKPTPTPINQAPIIYSTQITTATVGVIYIYDVEATDPDGDTLTYSLTTYPSNMNIHSATGVIIWIPTSAQVGNNPVVVKASDGALSDTQSFTVKVSRPSAPPPDNHAPIITSIPDDTAIVGTEYIYEVKATDPDGDVLIYSLAVKPDGMNIDSDTGLISWTPTSLQIGANEVTVKVSDGKKDITQNFTITVENFPIVIDGFLSPGEWDGSTGILVAGNMGTIRVLATANYLYVSFDVVDSTDARLGENPKGNDQISINVNPTHGGSWGFPYDLIFETSADLPWDPKINSGTIDGWNTRWFPNDVQEVLPGDLESVTVYSSGKRITEWMLPLDFMSVLPGEVLKVGGAIEVGDGSSYTYPIGLDWGDVSTYVDINVY